MRKRSKSLKDDNLMSNPSSFSLNYVIFMVDDEPYCLWSDKDIKNETLEFLGMIDPKYFEYQATTNLNKLNTKKHKQNAALAIRTAYSHGLETLFSLLCSAIQSPHCVPGWLLLCSNRQLYSVVKKIHSREHLGLLLKLDHVDWQGISSAIHSPLILADKEKEKSIKTRFGELWSRWASDYLGDTFRKEYNSIKHGFRVKAGGFSFAIGAEETPGVRPPQEKMQLIGKSDFGSSYFDYIPIGTSKQHVQLRRNSTNWDPEDMAWGLHLISISISNIVSFLKVINGVDATKVKFNWPIETETFREPWKRTTSLGVTALTGLGVIIPSQMITNYGKDDLKALYKEGKVLGKKIIKIKTRHNDLAGGADADVA